MKLKLSAETTPTFTPFNRYAYVVYMVLVIWLFIKGDYEWAFANMGIALVFDPFNPAVKWQQRPLYQKVWLLVHLAFTFSGLFYILFLKH